MRRLAKIDGQIPPSWTAFTHVERAILFLGSLGCGLVCLWTGDLFGVPREPGFNGSLLASGAAVSGIVVILLAMGICIAVSWFIAELIDLESGLFCCCVGLAALSVRCGPIRPVLQYATGPRVFISMALEVTILGIVVFLIWKIFGHLGKRKLGGEAAAPEEIADATILQKLLTTGVQVVVMGVCELILIQSDAKPQAMAGAGVAAFLGVLAAYMFTPLPSGIWYWIGPVALGVIGYAAAFVMGGSLAIGDVHGWAGALARPTPLDYAGMGIGGALLGYWCSRRWAQPEDSDEPIAAAE